MTLNIINLVKRPDRKSSLIDHLYDMKCNYQFWEGVYNPEVMAFKNIRDSHQMIVRDAKERKLKYVLIAEDDFRFSSENSLKYFIENIPETYDLYFGMVYTGTIQDRRITHGFSGLQFYMVHESFYDIFLSAPNNRHLDMWLGSQCYKYLFYCSDPFICYGESGYSDNFKKQWVFDEKKLPRNLLK